jgi:hypothetical protein
MTNWKGSGKNRSGQKALTQHFPVGAEENHGNLSRDSRSPGRDLNPGASEYEAGVLTTQLRRSVEG